MTMAQNIIVPDRRISVQKDRDFDTWKKEVNALVDLISSAREDRSKLDCYTKRALSVLLNSGDSDAANYAAFLTGSPTTRFWGSWTKLASKAVEYLEYGDTEVSRDTTSSMPCWDSEPCPVLGVTWKTWMLRNEMSGVVYAMEEKFIVSANSTLQAHRRRTHKRVIICGNTRLRNAVAEVEAGDKFLLELT